MSEINDKSDIHRDTFARADELLRVQCPRCSSSNFRESKDDHRIPTDGMCFDCGYPAPIPVTPEEPVEVTSVAMAEQVATYNRPLDQLFNDPERIPW